MPVHEYVRHIVRAVQAKILVGKKEAILSCRREQPSCEALCHSSWWCLVVSPRSSAPISGRPVGSWFCGGSLLGFFPLGPLLLGACASFPHTRNPGQPGASGSVPEEERGPLACALRPARLHCVQSLHPLRLISLAGQSATEAPFQFLAGLGPMA